jgi:hypothetical protein
MCFLILEMLLAVHRKLLACSKVNQGKEAQLEREEKPKPV